MKKVIVFLLTLVLAFSMVACGGGGDSGDSRNVETEGNDISAESKPNYKQIEAVKKEYCIVDGYDGGYDVNYLITAKNPNADVIAGSQNISVTARDKNGDVLGTDDAYLPYIYPGQENTQASSLTDLDEKPAEVEIELAEVDDNEWFKISEFEHEDYTPLTTSGVKIRSDKIVGDVVNPNDYEIESSSVIIAFRDKKGKLVDFDYTYAEKIPANGKSAFDIYVWDDKPENYDVYVNAQMELKE